MRRSTGAFSALGLAFPMWRPRQRHSNQKILATWIFTMVGFLLAEKVCTRGEVTPSSAAPAQRSRRLLQMDHETRLQLDLFVADSAPASCRNNCTHEWKQREDCLCRGCSEAQLALSSISRPLFYGKLPAAA